MRLWSIHPKYLDQKGLTAVWREGLLAQKVLLGETKGYQNHPQLIRFRNSPDPVAAIGAYLLEVAKEAERRGYTFNVSKIIRAGGSILLTVTEGQIAYEWQHLLGKLKSRSPDDYARNAAVGTPDAHPIFQAVPGGIELWERTKSIY